MFWSSITNINTITTEFSYIVGFSLFYLNLDDALSEEIAYCTVHHHLQVIQVYKERSTLTEMKIYSAVKKKIYSAVE